MPRQERLNPEATKLFYLYVHELWWLAHSIKVKSEKLFVEAMVPEDGQNVIQVNPDMHSLIASILSDAANIKKLINTPNGKSSGESNRQYRLRMDRSGVLFDLVSKANPQELLKPKVRNTLEHFDEYLDELNVRATDTTKNEKSRALYNVVISRREVFDGPIYPIRMYVSAEKKFYNLRWDVDIGALHRESADIIACLSGHPAIGNASEPGGMILLL